jgi:hypothetical protein
LREAKSLGTRVQNRVSGLTFQEWDPSVGSDDTSAPVTMLVNSSELRAADFPLTEVSPQSLQLDAVARGGRRARGAAVRKLQGVRNSTFVLSCTLVKSYFSSFFQKKIKKSRIFKKKK